MPTGTLTGLADPEWRRRRASKAGRARTTVEYYLDRLADAAPLTPEQRARLSDLLAGRGTVG